MNSTLLIIVVCVVIFFAFSMTVLAKEIRKDIRKINDHQTRERPEARVFGKFGINISETTRKLISPPYKAYATDFDIEISASKLAEEIYSKPDDWQKILIKLQELLSAKASSISIPDHPVFKGKPCVTLLIDHSGSLKGAALNELTIAMYRVAQMLDQAKIPFEVLGFTTRSWQGGSSRIRWLSAGKPSNPGRLCDLLHIVYKSIDESFQSVSNTFAVMLEGNIRRENIDGEALLWAHSRFEKSGISNWLCIVVSDGTPADDSTMLANPKTFLDDHLVAVHQHFAKLPNIEIKNSVIEIGTREPMEKIDGLDVASDFAEDFRKDVAELIARQTTQTILH